MGHRQPANASGPCGGHRGHCRFRLSQPQAVDLEPEPIRSAEENRALHAVAQLQRGIHAFGDAFGARHVGERAVHRGSGFRAEPLEHCGISQNKKKERLD
eukprot:TRINITY_DN59624_c0_g1_i1.p3 TRINITY_DN59624_c0_g1~~TRINITY_DN59624_c0_g1_i1.p3  ORF type:complete len:100 (+),score=9.40 TRINITY_DN59624_c0_g1_i1:183-482(+)